ncbi:polysaccharide deacetylase family protein [Sphingobium sp. BYY-5]|uniref:polysaccharide deacetylase family protein n=1 Tax=Sphingobium sp. BYY-5 TaxID=2926400 RepID=UPI001FA75B0D|nr:polysaccharide deacetylase family protein [Sphingobium sp. BYY-5]MCI4592316.1 polysaccharide deacetylase family protein [Sphingobium sp. BYY-5]
MASILLRIGAVLLGTAMMVAQAQAGPWPGGRKAAVVLTYDDALPSHLDIAIPALDAVGLKGTFFLIGSALVPEQIRRWREAAADGHELGNHTIRHACPQANYPPARKLDTSEAYDVEMMLAEIRTMNTMLAAIDGKLQHGFATPCGQHMAGGVDYLPALRASGLVRYTRSAAWTGGKVLDPMDVPCRWFDEKATGAQMIAEVESAARTGDLVVLGFHGVGGDYLRVPGEAHAQLLVYLKEHADTIWVAPLSMVMDYAASRAGN